MTSQEKNKAIFDALLQVAAEDAFQREIDALPSIEELNSIYQPSEQFDRKIKALIRNSYFKNRFKKILRKAIKIAACIAVVFMLLSVTLLSVKATRNAIFNALIEWREKYAEIRFEDQCKIAESSYMPTYLPEGYELHSSNTIGNSLMIIYMNEAGHRIIFEQKPTDSGTALIDNENTDFSEIELGGKTAYLFNVNDENEMRVLIWQSNGYVFQLTSQLSPDEMVKIGASIRR
jgi:hypothetical protein